MSVTTAASIRAECLRPDGLPPPVVRHQTSARELSISISTFTHAAVERYRGAENAAAPDVAL